MCQLNQAFITLVRRMLLWCQHSDLMWTSSSCRTIIHAGISWETRWDATFISKFSVLKNKGIELGFGHCILDFVFILSILRHNLIGEPGLISNWERKFLYLKIHRKKRNCNQTPFNYLCSFSLSFPSLDKRHTIKNTNKSYLVRERAGKI